MAIVDFPKMPSSMSPNIGSERATYDPFKALEGATLQSDSNNVSELSFETKLFC